LFLSKIGWATLWAIFSQTHPVTLIMCHILCIGFSIPYEGKIAPFSPQLDIIFYIFDFVLSVPFEHRKTEHKDSEDRPTFMKKR
jgi:hypothetical protein